MKYYIATGFARVKEHNALRDKLTALGHEITYDWTLVQDEKGPAIAYSEVWGVRSADFVVVLLPGKYGTHVELGVALGHSIKVFLCGWTEEWTCVFYEHPLVTRHTESDLIQAIQYWCHFMEEEKYLPPKPAAAFPVSHAIAKDHMAMTAAMKGPGHGTGGEGDQ